MPADGDRPRTLHFAQKDSAVYDLGCSTGTLLRHLVTAIPKTKKIRFVGLDNSEPMLKNARGKLKGHLKRCELVEADLESDFKLSDASVVIMNYTLQFIPPKRRDSHAKKFTKDYDPAVD